MGFLYSLSALLLGLAMVSEKLVSVAIGMALLARLVPAFVGKWGGFWVAPAYLRGFFRHLLFASLLLLGGYITVWAIWL